MRPVEHHLALTAARDVIEFSNRWRYRYGRLGSAKGVAACAQGKRGRGRMAEIADRL
ncbi:hypothetical protein [Rhizobium phaseoli]|uniref:hypothetical protein n=1 Tax=Rhizobium phaseoli TaxID=396 RepID=UPI001F269027|nr:hypothetical protein [Rhizobium phaseoli]